MLKVGSKRRRTQTQIKQEKEEALLKQVDIATKLARLDQMEQELQAIKQSKARNEEAATILDKLVNDGVVNYDDNGQLTSPSKQKQPQ